MGVTTIMVTHDQEEALTMADRIILMNNGVIEQDWLSSRYSILSLTTAFTANFIGNHKFNLRQKKYLQIQ